MIGIGNRRRVAATAHSGSIISRRLFKMKLLLLLIKILFCGLVATMLGSIVLYHRLVVSGDEREKETIGIMGYPLVKNRVEDDSAHTRTAVHKQVEKVMNEKQQAILDFFHGDHRAVEDGIIYLATENDDKKESTLKEPVHSGQKKSSGILAKRLAQRIHRCTSKTIPKNMKTKQYGNGKDCMLRIAFVGSAQMAGRDNFHNQTFPFVARDILQDLALASGLTLDVVNHAMDHDMSREGPQTNHMCIENLIGGRGSKVDLDVDVDVIVWGFDDVMMASRQIQFESFVRWSLSLLNPAMIVVQRDGPHGMSRRGIRTNIVSISEGHDAIVYRDQDVEHLPKQRTEVYRESSQYKERWGRSSKPQHQRHNGFWNEVARRYAPSVDIVGLDPLGSIWHQDHLVEFSNQAMDGDKVLPLLDCGFPAHAPPCDKIPEFVRKNAKDNHMKLEDLPKDFSGALCGGKWGCRHFWYGGTRSHDIRGHLNAIVIIQAFQDAFTLTENLKSEDMKDYTLEKTPQTSQHCSKIFCGKIPSCITSYEPNLGLRLQDHLITHNLPLGAAHYGNKPDFQLRDMEKRFAPLEYVDRKFGYMLMGKKSNAKNVDSKEDKEGLTFADISFHSKTGGPLVLCEPPCFIDQCPTKRVIPIIHNVTIFIDNENVTRSMHNKQMSSPLGTVKDMKFPEMGKYCHLVAQQVTKGDHVIRISTNMTPQYFVMISHIISF